MTVVYKYPLPEPCDRFELLLPGFARVLHVGVQHGRRYLWARVDPDAALVPRYFRWAGTGHPLEDDVWDHVGTWLEADGALVWHLFEVVR